MADDFVELAFEGVDKVSDPDFYYHRKRKAKRDSQYLRERQDAIEEDRGLSDAEPHSDNSTTMLRSRGRRDRDKREIRRHDSPTRGHGDGESSADEGDRDPFDDPRGRYQYPDARNPDFNRVRDGDGRYYQPPTLEDNNKPHDQSRRKGGQRRPGLRSRSSHQGDRTSRRSAGEDDRQAQRSSSQTRPRRRSRHFGDPPPKETALHKWFSDSNQGIGALLVGTAAGGLLAHRAARKKPGGEPMVATLVGALVGGVGANAVERYVEHGMENGRVRDKWGEEVGQSRRKYRDKMADMTLGVKARSRSRSRSRSWDRDGRRRGTG